MLLSFFTPLAWLERVPTYKDLVEKHAEQGRDILTYGFLGYPLMQAADILIYRANKVPVGEDQVSHIELTREIARRFNHLFGREKGFEEKAEAAIKKMGPKKAKLYRAAAAEIPGAGRRGRARRGAQALVDDVQNLSLGDKERLYGFIEGGGRMILAEPEALLTETPKLLGLDGQKMSKSYDNAIMLREAPDAVTKKIRTMQTDPARVRRTDPGEPEQLPGVEPAPGLFRRRTRKEWVLKGCTQRRHRLPRVQAAGDRLDQRGVEADPRARRAVRGGSDAGAQHHPGRVREGVRSRGRDDARCSRGHGP